jgi:nucleotide-binding universal stress UspA family protein
MSAFKSILVPTDFSEGSKAALTYARSLADAAGASLCILHAFDPWPIQYAESGYFPADFLEQLEQEARSRLDEALNADERRRYNAETVLIKGPAPKAILSYLNEHRDVDLVVMATHGRGGVARLMMGSVADKVVRAAPCPVVTIRAEEQAAEAGRAA